MTITVLDTYAGIDGILRAPVAERSELLATMLKPMAGMYRYFPGEVDLVAMHQMGLGFPLDRDVEKSHKALAVLRDANAWERTQNALDDALAIQLATTPNIEVPDITVLVILGDPADDYFIGQALGVSGNGGMSGYITVTLWPTPENLSRLEATAAHELNHNLRYSPGGVVWNPSVVTVGEQIVSEGLADAFARQIYGQDLGYTRIGMPHLGDDVVFDKVVTGLEITGMYNFTAWVHGDAAAARFGAAPVGLPTGSGYAVGNRLVDAYLARAGGTAADALHVDSGEIIDVALNRM